MAEQWGPPVFDMRKVLLGNVHDGPGLRPDFPHLTSEEKRDPLTLFLVCLPMAFMETTIIPATNANLMASYHAPMSKGEFLRWLGIALLMSCYPGIERDDCFTPGARDKEAPIPDFRHLMGRNRFRAITQCLALQSAALIAAEAQRDRFIQVRGFIEAWCQNMERKFNPGWRVCLDESMVAWLERWTCPGWMNLPRKPHPFGNQYHTIACGLTHVIFKLELVEGKDRPAHRPLPEFEAEHGKTCSLILRMTQPLFAPGRVVIMDSAFCQLRAIVQLFKRGLFATSVIKKRRYWPKHIDGAALDAKLADSPMGTAVARCGQMADVPFQLLAVRDSKHVLKLVSTYGTLERGEKEKRRYIASTKTHVEFKYPKVVEDYYATRHAVDDNNNIRQGSASLEANFLLKSWEKRQFLALTAISEANALAFFNYQRGQTQENEPFSLANFRRKLAKALIYNEFLAAMDVAEEEEEEQQPRKLRRSVREGHHELVMAPPYSGKWDGEKWKEVSTQYLRRKCAGPNCEESIRTHCVCNNMRFWCQKHFYTVHQPIQHE